MAVAVRMTAERVAAAAIAFLAVAVCQAEPALAVAPNEPLPGVFGPPEGTYATQQVLVPSTFAPGAVARYRFSGQEAWLPFDRPLYLSAFPGEDRRYSIEFRTPSGASTAVLGYQIDMRAPEPPAFTTPEGNASPELSFGVDSGDIAYLSVDGSSFEEFPRGGRKVYQADPGGVRIVSATAYAVDAAGNASRYVSARWRLYPAGYAPERSSPSPSPAKPIVIASPSGDLSAEVTDIVGAARLVIKAPEGTVPCIAVNAADPLSSAASYADLSGSSAASCDIPFPWGYEKEIIVHYGFLKDGIRHVAREPLRIVPRFPADDAEGAPSTPVGPSVRVQESAAYIQWPASPWTMMLSVAGGDFVPCLEPFRLPLGDTPATIRYYALDRSGARSATLAITLPAAYVPAIPYLDGVENGGAYGSSVVVLPGTATRVRFESAEGDGTPPPVRDSSPAMDKDGLRFDGIAGRVVRYKIRVAADVPAPPAGMITETSLERFYEFSIDREPPPAPELAQGLRSFSSSDSAVSFKPLDGTIFVSVSEDGNGPFERYDGPMALNGSDEGRKRYVIRAYAEDQFGNRSVSMDPASVLIDKSSLYADASGRPGASGSPDDPIPYLDEAIEAAQASGKRFVYVRGTIALRRTVVVSGRLTVSGGFDQAWNESGALAAISVRVPLSSSSFAFVVDGGALALSSVRVDMALDGTGGIVLARSGTASLARASLSLSGGVDATVVKSTGAGIRVESSTMSLSSCVTCRGLEASGARLDLTDSAIYCDASVRMLDAIRVQDSETSIAGLRVEASPSQAISVLHASRSTVRVEGAAAIVGGGSSSCRIFGANAADLTFSSVYINASWKGSAEAFSGANGSSVRIAHVTAIMEAPRSTFANLSGSTVEVYNTIASFAGTASVFMRSDLVPKAGTVAANCLWGFSSFLEGRVAAATLLDLNRFAGAGKPSFSESPARTFASPVKGIVRLSRASKCVDAGIPVPWASPVDLLGTARSAGSAGMPDIGAEEL